MGDLKLIRDNQEIQMHDLYEAFNYDHDMDENVKKVLPKNIKRSSLHKPPGAVHSNDGLKSKQMRKSRSNANMAS